MKDIYALKAEYEQAQVAMAGAQLRYFEALVAQAPFQPGDVAMYGPHEVRVNNVFIEYDQVKYQVQFRRKNGEWGARFSDTRALVPIMINS